MPSADGSLCYIDRMLLDHEIVPQTIAKPGSFTGLRVGLATVLGLHQALGLPATALPTLEVLGCLGPGDGSTVVAVVDALRGEWFAQRFESAAVPLSGAD